MKKPLNRQKVWGKKGKVTLKRKKISPIKIWSERFTGLFKKEKAGASKNAQVTKRKVNTPSYSKSIDSKDIKMKVLKPKKDYFVKQAIKSKIKLNESPKRTFSWGQKDFSSLTKKVRNFSFENTFKNFNYYIVKWKVGENLNRIIFKTCGVISLISILYLSFFDTFFLIKTYTIEYDDGSYLSEPLAKDLIEELKNERIIGMFPNNQLWFINSQNITLTAKNYSENVERVEVTKRLWPNQAKLKVSTKPTLMTLNINNGEYWRIGHDGSIITEDTAELKDRVVSVQRPVFLDTSNADFGDYPLQQNTDQLNRIFFIDWLWETLEQEGLSPVKTEIPSLQDTDVSIETNNETQLMFNAEAIKKDLQVTRIRGVFANQEIAREFNEGVIAYIDFRIPKKVFVCYKNTECSR